MFLGQLSSTLPAGVDASIVLESVDTLKSHSDWPEIVHAMSLAIKVRVFRHSVGSRVSESSFAVFFAGHMGRMLPMPWHRSPGRCLFQSVLQGPGADLATRTQISMFTRKISLDDAVAAREDEKAPGGAAAPLETV